MFINKMSVCRVPKRRPTVRPRDLTKADDWLSTPTASEIERVVSQKVEDTRAGHKIITRTYMSTHESNSSGLWLLTFKMADELPINWIHELTISSFVFIDTSMSFQPTDLLEHVIIHRFRSV